jgi:hypothetical protein
MKDAKRELTAIEAARKLGIGLMRLYLLLWSAKLPGDKRGNRWYVPVEAVEARLRKFRGGRRSQRTEEEAERKG